MEWVIALLAIGCIFFAIQVVVDFVKYKREIEPKIMRSQEMKEQLQTKIRATEADLAKAHSGLNPVREQVQELEKEHEEMNSQIESETAKQHNSWKLPRKNG